MAGRKSLSKRTRFEIFKRDGYRCRYCGASQDLTVDHVVPRALGGSDEIDNLVVACRPCNSKKSARTPKQAGMVLRPLEA